MNVIRIQGVISAIGVASPTVVTGIRKADPERIQPADEVGHRANRAIDRAVRHNSVFPGDDNHKA